MTTESKAVSQTNAMGLLRVHAYWSVVQKRHLENST